MVSKDNVRTILTLPKDFKTVLEELAKKQNRSLNNYIITVLKNNVESSK